MKPNSEDLVEKCYALRTEAVHFVRAPKNGKLDSSGIDFIVGWNGHGPEINLQIKTSNNGRTMGIIIPMPINQLEQILSGRMLIIAMEHHRKYPLVEHLLFVAHPNDQRTEEEILKEIWVETTQKLLPQEEKYKSVI